MEIRRLANRACPTPGVGPVGCPHGRQRWQNTLEIG